MVALPDVAVGPRGEVSLARKTITGLDELAARWPGPVIAVARAEQAVATSNIGMVWTEPHGEGWELSIGEPTSFVQRVAPDVCQVSLHLRDRPLLSVVPSVVVAENPAMERFKYALASASKAHVPRMAVGALRQSRALLAMVRSGAALACNGWAAWDAYNSHTKAHAVPPSLFFDNRLTASQVSHARQHRNRPGRRRPGTVQLGFSGRLHRAKGPHFALAASGVLASRGFSHSLAMLGTGPEEAVLRSAAGDQVSFVGALPFEPDWVEFVSTSVDLMLLPHIQGDPSGSYVETAGLGVPVLGFANAALRGHERHGGFARTTRARSGRALADLVERVWREQEVVQSMSTAGLDFMANNHVEAEFDTRVDQLLAVHHAVARS